MKTEPIHIRPGLSLYKQPITSYGGSPYWYARVRLKIAGRCVHTKSTGTTDEKLATKLAEEFFSLCYAKSCGFIPVNEQIDPRHRFDMVADEWLDRKQRDAGSDPRKLRGYDDARKLLLSANGPAAFFKRKDIALITTDDVREYLVFAETHSRNGKLASTTKRNHLSVLGGILRFAAERRMIVAAPPMPKLHLVDNPRSYFTRDEITKLYAALSDLRWKERLEGNREKELLWIEMEAFITFMLATFLRAGEWKHLRQRDCVIVDGPHRHLKVWLLKGKIKPREIVSMPEAIKSFENIVEHYGADPDALLFLPRYKNRETAKERMDDFFRELTEKAGLTMDRFGKKRTLYSLRHSSLMLRLIEGDNPNLFMLAKNAGTSMKLLERFYLSHAEPAMAVAELHATKPLPPPKRSGMQVYASLAEPESRAHLIDS